MNKETIEIRRRNKIPQGYGQLYYLNNGNLDFDNGLIDSYGNPTQSFIMGKICDFTRNKDIKVYSHEVRNEFVLREDYEPYTSKNFVGEIPQGDLIYYLDIYWQ